MLPALVEEVLDAVRAGVPAYAAPLEGTFGRTVRVGVEQALGGFVELIESGSDVEVPGREVYVALGRGEVRQGRELDALLAAYRAGALVAWRRFAEAASGAGAAPDTLIRLAEAVFAFIDELSAASAEGYAEAAGERQDRRRRLLDLLLAPDPPAAADLDAAAKEAGWRIPKAVAVVVFDHERPARLAPRLPPDALVGAAAPAAGGGVAGGAGGASGGGGAAAPGGAGGTAAGAARGVAVIADPNAPARLDALRTAFRGHRAAIGPTVAPHAAALSAARAATALALARDDAPLLRADDHLLDLLVLADRGLAEDLVARRLAPLEALTDANRARLLETLQAWLDHHGEARPAAGALHVHVQTVRYRLNRLRDLLGEALDAPSARLELALALHARAALAEADAGAAAARG
ncbi:MAG TPA: helix-turn-helix domain-containing protein [Solirubrobacteraceae bacterium]